MSNELDYLGFPPDIQQWPSAENIVNQTSQSGYCNDSNANGLRPSHHDDDVYQASSELYFNTIPSVPFTDNLASSTGLESEDSINREGGVLHT